MALTLTQLLAVARDELRDGSSAIWSDAQLTTALRDALQEYNQRRPRQIVSTLTFGSTTREISLATLTGLLAVLEVWLPYTAANPEWPPNTRAWRIIDDTLPTLRIEDGEPISGDVARILYTKPHTIDGLDSATSSTISSKHERDLAIGMAYHAQLARSRQMTEAENVSGGSRFGSRRTAEDYRGSWERFLASLGQVEGGYVEWNFDEVERLRRDRQSSGF